MINVAEQMSERRSGIPVSEGARRATEETGIPTTKTSPDHADPHVPVHTTRRRLTTSYKLKVLQKVSELKTAGNGPVGAYLRKEGLYYSSVNHWQKQLDAGTLGIMKKHRRKGEKSREALVAENKKNRRKIEQLKKKLHKTELLVELQKKISQMMEMENETSV